MRLRSNKIHYIIVEDVSQVVKSKILQAYTYEESRRSVTRKDTELKNPLRVVRRGTVYI